MLFFLFALLLCQKVWSSPPHRQLSPNNAPGQMTDQTSIKYPATEAEYMKRRDEMQKSQKEFELPDMQLSEVMRWWWWFLGRIFEICCIAYLKIFFLNSKVHKSINKVCSNLRL